MTSSKMEVRDILAEAIHEIMSDSPSISPEELAKEIVKTLALECEWAVAEYDQHGNLSHVRHHDYEFDSVHRKFSLINSEMEGGIGLVSRLFTPWSRV